jgi:hypothetical protein
MEQAMPLSVSGKIWAIAVIAVLTVTAPALLGAASAQSQSYYPLPRSAAGVPARQVSGTTTPIHAVSMRAGPGTDNPVIGTLQPGMSLQILASANYGWMQVQSPVGTGWVYGSYLASGTDGPAPSYATPTSENIAPGSANAPAPINNNRPASANQPPPEITSP